jgi:hypothetical protein
MEAFIVGRRAQSHVQHGAVLRVVEVLPLAHAANLALHVRRLGQICKPHD